MEALSARRMLSFRMMDGLAKLGLDLSRGWLERLGADSSDPAPTRDSIPFCCDEPALGLASMLLIPPHLKQTL